VAKRSNNTLSLRAVCNTPPAGLMDTNSAEFQEAVAASLEEIPSGGDPKGREMDHKTDCGVDSKDTDDVILGTKETADPDQAAEEMVDVKESGATKVDPIVAEDQTRKKENKRKLVFIFSGLQFQSQLLSLWQSYLQLWQYNFVPLDILC